ncbi:MAG: bifunctional hydroxymethylpyrimidine kinase/phosphomethylpyrimidine kinase [Actinobacteria bacterium]|nr:bifunctional hydroxymethylpyrimidine kinase/phosphomethylpyrimidine kinase [Actinomycetota bacterium]
MRTYQRALTIAGSDSGGGAGIQADLKTFSALGCYGTSVITALTAQNTVGVTAIHPVPADIVAAQIDAVLDDIGTDATKIGMLHSATVIDVVADRLRHREPRPVVLDPVMVATSGAVLLEDDAIDALRSRLLPVATVITPNLAEAAMLLGGGTIDTVDDMEAAARELASLGPRVVLCKGGHLKADHSVDVYYDADTRVGRRLDAPRIDTLNTHGTGCTLSSAIAAHLARGNTMDRSIAQAKTYLTDAIRAGADRELAAGHGPVHHFVGWWASA